MLNANGLDRELPSALGGNTNSAFSNRILAAGFGNEACLHGRATSKTQQGRSNENAPATLPLFFRNGCTGVGTQ